MIDTVLDSELLTVVQHTGTQVDTLPRYHIVCAALDCYLLKNCWQKLSLYIKDDQVIGRDGTDYRDGTVVENSIVFSLIQIH